MFGNIGLLYKDILLDNAIDLKSLGKTSAKGIKEFATDLSEATLGYPNWNSSTPHNSYGYTESTVRKPCARFHYT